MGAPTSRNEIRVTDRTPLVIVEFFGAPDDDEFARYLAKIEALAEFGASRPQVAGDRGAILFDTTHASRPITASQRRMQAEHMRRMKTTLRSTASQNATGVCFVFTNSIVRGVLTAILWLQPMSERYEVCSTRELAETWCRGWIMGLEPPADVSP